MKEFTREEIIARHFGRARKGYAPMAVDEYLEDVAEYVGWLRSELLHHQAKEGAALELLQKAQHVSDQKLMAAALSADQFRAAAEAELSAARAEAGRLLEGARVESDRIVASAQSRAVVMENECRERIAESEVAAQGRLDGIENLVAEMSRIVNETAVDLRDGGDRLHGMADRFQFELTVRSESLEVGDIDIR